MIMIMSVNILSITIIVFFYYQQVKIILMKFTPWN